MQRTRNNNRGQAYQEYLADKAREDAEAKAAADAAEAAAMQTPEAQYKASINQLFTQERNVVLHGGLSDAYLSQFKQFGTLKRGTCSESEAIAARVKFRETTPTYIRNNTNGATLVALVKRNGLLESDPVSYAVCWEICKIWGLVVDADPVEEVPVPVAEVVPVVEVDTRTPSEIAEAKYKARMTEIVVYDPIDNQGYTEFDLENKVDSKTELRLRRLTEGRIGNEQYAEYMNRKDWQAAERARIAAEQEGGN
jgi:hypothetical protein